METITRMIFMMRDLGVGTDFVKQVPYWERCLDEEYGRLDYDYVLYYVRKMGCHIFRNSSGRHMLKYECSGK